MGSLNDKILKFLDVGYGYGMGIDNGNGFGGFGIGFGKGYDNGGSGQGDGFGDGYGYGIDNGNGKGFGYGFGDGFDNGYLGYGYGIEKYNGYDVYLADGIPTIITHLHGNIAKGFVAKNNLFIVPCYVARVDNYLAHGSTAKEALADAQTKYEQNRPLEERIADFKAQYPSIQDIVPNDELYRWHNILTGSCAFGRQHFAEQHNIDIDNGSMSVLNFIDLAINQYGRNAIEQLKESYN